jgi:hypothetical protein
MVYGDPSRTDPTPGIRTDLIAIGEQTIGEQGAVGEQVGSNAEVGVGRVLGD